MSELVRTRLVCWMGDGCEYAFESSGGYAVQVEQDLIDRAERAKAEYEDVQDVLADIYQEASERGERTHERRRLLSERSKIEEQLRDLGRRPT